MPSKQSADSVSSQQCVCLHHGGRNIYRWGHSNMGQGNVNGIKTFPMFSNGSIKVSV